MDIASLTGHELANVDAIPSPALLIYPHRVQENIQRLLQMVGGDATRLRPHVKTHKSGAIVRMQLDAGITKFKCATIAEAEMTADAGAQDVLLAYQLVGPNFSRMVALATKFPACRFSALVDNVDSVDALAQCASSAGVQMGAWIDLDCGMHRTGIEPGADAVNVYARMCDAPNIEARGLHAYDGHIHDASQSVRTSRSNSVVESVKALRDQLVEAGHPVPAIVAGGTPTFPMHAQEFWAECSPGTCLLTDAGYGTAYEDMDFVPAAFVLTRVISKPGANRICLDLGHKAVSAENPLANRVRFPALPDAQPVSQSEEHLVVETARAADISVGDPFYGLPWHICPTLALYNEAVVVAEDGTVSEYWPILARARRITL
ncbi:MAG: D-serine deaminase-like pyridoxal phosphate-dependent protein [Verrucomicrobiales bacterium]|jgi:D-serine deaminase-like pyridoxal phosphate-dependent protein